MWQLLVLFILNLHVFPSKCSLESNEFNNTYNRPGRQSLRSASRFDFVVPHARTAIKQHEAFSIVGLSVWNSLRSEIRSLPWDLSSSFYKLLKLLFSPGPGLAAHLSSYLEVALDR